MHQVTEKLEACKGGCFSVTGILFQLDNGPDNELLERESGSRGGVVEAGRGRVCTKLSRFVWIWYVRAWQTAERFSGGASSSASISSSVVPLHARLHVD